MTRFRFQDKAWLLLKDSWQVFCLESWSMLRHLFPSVLLQLLSFTLVLVFAPVLPKFFYPTWLLIGAMFVLLLLTLGLFFKGFMDYLTYLGSLNINVCERLEGQAPDYKTAFHVVKKSRWPLFIRVVCAQSLVALLPIGLYVLLSILAWSLNNAFWIQMLAILFSMALGVLCLLFLGVNSLLYQVTILDKRVLSVLQVFQENMRLFMIDPALSLLTLCLAYGLMNLLLPVLLLTLCQWLGLTGLLRLFWSPSLESIGLSQWQVILAPILSEASLSLLGSFFFVLIPTILFTSLYKTLKAQESLTSHSRNNG